MSSYKELIIVIAEDDLGHAELIKEGLIDSGVHNRIIHFVDGEEAWSYFSCKNETNKMEKSKNYLLLLDINMPRMDGVELLRKNEKF